MNCTPYNWHLSVYSLAVYIWLQASDLYTVAGYTVAGAPNSRHLDLEIEPKQQLNCGCFS